MTDIEAADLLSRVQKDIRILFSIVTEDEKVLDLYQAKHVDEWVEELNKFARKNDKIFIYGAGKYGQQTLKLLEKSGIECQGFIVSDGRIETKEICGYRIYESKEITDINAGIILGLGYEKRWGIIDMLHARGFNNILEGL